MHMDATTPYIVGPMFDHFETLRNNSQQHTTKCQRVCKQMQHVTSKNVGELLANIMLDPFAWGFKTGIL